jgi:hypothetical protein
MNPVRQMTFDARPVAPQFLDGNPITDGMANLFASAINAPIAANQIRRQREMDDRQMMLQDQELARQNMLDDRAVQWHNQEQATRGRDTGLQVARQNRQDAMAAAFQQAQMKNMDQDNARQMAAMFGNGVNNAAARGIDAVKAMRGLFGGAKGQSTPAASLWYTFKGDDGSMYKINRQSGEIVPAVPAKPAPDTSVRGPAFDVPRQTNPQLAEVILGAGRQASPVPWAVAPPAAAAAPSVAAAQPPAAVPAGAPPVEAEFVTQHSTRLAGLPAGPARQDYLRRLRAANPALYQAVVQLLTSTAAR